MPIKNLTEKTRIQRDGKLHLGRPSGQGYPEPIDFFLVKEDPATPASSVKAFHELYGEKPTELDVMIFADNLDDVIPQWWKQYKKRGTSGVLVCRGDGQDAHVYDETTGEWSSVDGKCLGCTMPKEDKCKRIANFKFMLPRLRGGGLWQIDTGSINSIRNINGTLETAFAAARSSGRHVSTIKLLLSVQMEDIQYKYRDKKNNELRQGVRKLPIMHLKFGDSMADLIKQSDESNRPAAASPQQSDAAQLPPPPTAAEATEVPEDLVPTEVLEKHDTEDAVDKELDTFFKTVADEHNAGIAAGEVDSKVAELKSKIEKCSTSTELRQLTKDMNVALKDLPNEMRVQLTGLYNAKSGELLSKSIG